MWKNLGILIDDKIIRHFRDSRAPVQELSLATAVGFFWALTPLVGIQMMLTTFTWVIFKSAHIRFNLPIALALVWITNPITMPFFYYTFYITGYLSFKLLGFDIAIVSFRLFKETLIQANEMNLIDGLTHWVRYVINDLGWPMMLGSLIVDIPATIISYPVSKYIINNYRKQKATSKGLSLHEWEDKYVHAVDKENMTLSDELIHTVQNPQTNNIHNGKAGAHQSVESMSLKQKPLSEQRHAS